jgi:hypothetical protein
VIGSLRNIIVLSLVMMFGCGGSALRDSDVCGRVFQHAEIDAVIYALCPELPDMNPNEIAEAIDYVFESVGGIDRESIIYFFNDDRIVAPTGGWPADYLRRVESWGPALVGWYYSHGNTATIRDKASGGWREVELPLQQLPSSIAACCKQSGISYN